MSSYVRHVGANPQSRPETLRATAVLDACDVDVVHLDAVKVARAALPNDLDLARMAELLALLSSPTRLRMLLALQPKERRTRRALCVCDLATVTGASKSSTSHQLRRPRGASIVAVRPSGKHANYRLADGPAVALFRGVLAMSATLSRTMNRAASVIWSSGSTYALRGRGLPGQNSRAGARRSVVQWVWDRAVAYASLCVATPTSLLHTNGSQVCAIHTGAAHTNRRWM